MYGGVVSSEPWQMGAHRCCSHLTDISYRCHVHHHRPLLCSAPAVVPAPSTTEEKLLEASFQQIQIQPAAVPLSQKPEDHLCKTILGLCRV